jgi:hypothetical protein
MLDMVRTKLEDPSLDTLEMFQGAIEGFMNHRDGHDGMDGK